MWDPDHFPGADHVPWPLLIRARFAYQVDAVIASHVVNRLGPLLSDQHAVRLVEAALRVEESDEKASPESVVAAMAALADFDDWCPTRPRVWPPKKRGFDDLTDPIARLVLEQARVLVGAASPALQESMGEVLGGVARG